MDKGILSNVKVPKDWSEISLKQFRKIAALEEKQKEAQLFVEKISKENGQDEIDLNSIQQLEDFIVEFIFIMTGIDKEIIKNLPLDKLQDLAITLKNFTNTPIPIIKEPFIEIDGVLYMMDLNFNTLSFGTYIDLKMFPQNSKGKWDYAHSIAAVFLRPVTKTKSLLIKGKKLLKRKPNPEDYKISKYNHEEALKTSELFLEKLPMTYVYTIISFFLTRMQLYATNIVDSSNQETQKKKLTLEIQKN